MKIPLSYNARSLLQRPVSTAFTALGIALVVAVFIGMLALANGFRAALVQLSVPAVTATAAWPLLGEPITARLLWSALLILGGILLACSVRDKMS